MSTAEQTAESDCLFCRIASGAIPTTFLFASPSVVAFSDIAPGAPTHILVVPRTHVTDAAALGPDDGQLLAELFGAAQTVAAEAGIAADGYRLVMNVGEDAGNSVPHLHLHVIGGRRMAWPPG
jgi:histidine triad (HIT) family protein